MLKVVFFLKKLISYFLIPPGSFILLMLAVAFLGKGWARRLACIGAIALYLLSVEPVKDALLYPLEKSYGVPDKITGDVIVVLGGGTYNSGYLKASSYKRLVTGYILHRQTGMPLILSGGSATKNVSEAEVMRRLLFEMGVKERYVFVDVRSRDTAENALYVKEICEKLGCKRIVLITSAFHMRRAVRVFKKAGLDVLPYPTDHRFEGSYNLYSLFPKYSVFSDSSTAVREYLGILFYALFH